MKHKLYVVISLDVEEEGLFSGHYEARNPGVANVRHLRKLAPISLELGFPLTLFCAWSVFTHREAAAHVEFMASHCGAEVGGHLHHWSTPPFLPAHNPEKQPERTWRLPVELFTARLRSLLHAGRTFLGAPLTSFRMGRWDLKASLLPILAENGIQVDSSVCPLRALSDAPNHFLAPADPYWLDLPDNLRILEAPITQIPVTKSASRFWAKLAPAKLLDKFHRFGALSANPFWHGPTVMRLATRLHVARGGKVLSLFWHSSELMPGASPHVPDQKAADAALAKILTFCEWLKNSFDVEGLPITALTKIPQFFPAKKLEPSRDW